MCYLTENLLNRLESFLANDTIKSIEDRSKKGEFHYIPLNMEKFIEQMNVVVGLWDKSKGVPNFIDIGCGIGTKMIAANSILHGEVYGIEKDLRYVKIARRLLGTKNQRQYRIIPVLGVVIHGDALEHSYNIYDIIYFYCPLLDEKLQRKLEQRIIATARSGAYILANMKKDYNAWDTDPRVRRVWKDEIYQKV